MNGRFASLIVIASIFCTGFVGYLANADVEEDERQVYDYSANLVPSIISSDVQQYTPYNPAGNVTGWQSADSGTWSNARIPTTSVVSPYIISSRTVAYNTDWIDKADSVYYTKSTSEVILPNSTGWNQGEVEVTTVPLTEDFAETGYLIFVYDPTDSDNPVSVYLIDREVSGTDIINDLDEIIEEYVIEYAHYQGGFSVSKDYDGSNNHSTFRLSTRITDTLGVNILSSSASAPVTVARMSDLESEYETSQTFKTSDVIDLTEYKVYSVPDASNIGWDLRYVRESNTRVSMDYRWGATNATLIHDTNSTAPWGLYYNKDTNGWYPATKEEGGLWYQTSTQMYTSDKIAIVADTAQNAPVYELKWDSAVVTSATYADNTRMTEIGVMDQASFGTTAYWKNDNSNGAISFLAKLNNDTGNLTVTTKDKDGNVNGSWLAKTSASGGVVTSTGYVLINLDNINSRYTYTPVTSIAVSGGNANPQTYQVGGYSQNLDIIQSATGTDMNYLQLSYVNVEGEVYVTDTVVQLDPDGKLWSNPAIYLGAYFPEAFEPDNAPRVWFNAFVALGNTVRINGVDYAVSEGQITVGDVKVELKGMAIDWEKAGDGLVHVYIAPGGDYDKRIDLGVVDDSLQINGGIYPVTNGTIAVTPFGGGASQTVTVSDMSIKVQEVGGVFHVFIDPDDDDSTNNSIDIGPKDERYAIPLSGSSEIIPITVGYSISTEGVWYFEVGLYEGSTETYERLDLNITKGWGLSFSGACLLFCGCIILFTAIGTYYFKESENQPDFTDWLIIVMAIVLTIVIAGLLG